MSHQIGIFKAEQKRVQPPTADEWMVLSLTAPWAMAMFLSLKQIETRSWRTNYRGRLYIHSAKRYPLVIKDAFGRDELFMQRAGTTDLPCGVIIGHVALIDIQRTESLLKTVSAMEYIYGDYRSGRYGWITANPVLLDTPIQAKGSLGIWRYKVPVHKPGCAVAALCPCTCGYQMEKA